MGGRPEASKTRLRPGPSIIDVEFSCLDLEERTNPQGEGWEVREEPEEGKVRRKVEGEEWSEGVRGMIDKEKGRVEGGEGDVSSGGEEG